MANKFSKRGKNPGAIDSWLDSLGFYRKNVAYDETCLFRAVAEQLFTSQLYHEKVRKECIIYGKKHMEDLGAYFISKRDCWNRLIKLDLHMQICSDVEIQLICNTYRINISVLNANDHSVTEFQCNCSSAGTDTIRLCKMNEDHYDSVYTKQHITDAGFCQSIMYNLLYESVFEIPNVSSIVNAMLHEKQAVYTVFNCDNDVSVKEECFEEEEEVDSDDKLALASVPQPCIVAPFPFKVAKALDPNMYRNIEYDTWLEVRRAMRLGDWYYGDDKLILGTRCIVDINGVSEPCYIQEIKNNQCIVYITTLAQRKTVNYSDLKPEDNAKPWPLPFRFIRKLPQGSTELIKYQSEMSLKKRRDKPRAITKTTMDTANDTKTLDYQGCNLETSEVNASERHLTLKITNNCNNAGVDENQNWNQSNNLRRLEPISLPWLEQSTTCTPENGFSSLNKSPTAEQETTQGDNNFYYNYEPNLHIQVPVWIPPSYTQPSDPGVIFNQTENVSPNSDRCTQNVVYYQMDNPYTTPSALLTPPISTPSPTIVPLNPFINDRIVCSNPVTPTVDPYSYMCPVQPHTAPVYYSYPSHPPTYPTVAPRPPAPLPSPLSVYTSPDVQYLTTPYIYSPQTPPISWFPSNVSPQGFIFPAPLN
ncbi:hypothetical protein PPYR_03954 [Photinus pyralis]|uniref:OTU domain-containing protein n=1 Tax=Photinus pyralis TaxID=7054 RepID=A0A1Y1LTQ1_PHOPY|nr:protein ovarian tumor locus-like [Photinus pyralis]KAB0801768.1 hypothetical protein PPYR_03954 [Photinus pyralis]